MAPPAGTITLPGGPEAVRAVCERYRVAVGTVATARRSVALLQVADLDALVDRAALLSGEHPCEPPYWTYLWTGAIELARRIDAEGMLGGRRALDLRCGLGLVGVVAALAGAEVTGRRRRCAPRDAHRMDTAGFYVDLERAGYRMSCRTVRTREEGLPLRVDLMRAARSWRRS